MPDSETQLMYKIGVTLLPNVGDITAKKLIAYCGSAEAVFKEKKSNLAKIPGLGRVYLSKIKTGGILEKAENELGFIQKYHIKILYFEDRDYPERLKQCIDSPVMLYYKGKSDLNASKIVSIVGTRKVSDYGKETVGKLVEGLSGYKVLIISGLAYGVDTCAHKFALENKLETVAVLGHGLDRIYPQANKTLAEKMLNQGGLLTDFPSGTKPDRENFPKRNRIVAGLSDATIVIESARKGGALITADIANSYNRDVFTFPGRVGDKYSEGCNFLIKTNRAALIENAGDLIYMMGWEETKPKPAQQKKLFITLTDEEKLLVELLESENELGIDKLCIASKMNATKVASALLNLEFKGVVRCLPGKVYRLL